MVEMGVVRRDDRTLALLALDLGSHHAEQPAYRLEFRHRAAPWVVQVDAGHLQGRFLDQHPGVRNDGPTMPLRHHQVVVLEVDGGRRNLQ